jgi:hypothetical protein
MAGAAWSCWEVMALHPTPRSVTFHPLLLVVVVVLLLL